MQTRIREVRKAKRLTLAEVAQRCDPPTTAQTISRLEVGLRTVSVDWLNRIAGALGVDASDLVRVDERPDVPVAALLTASGAEAPNRPMVLTPPRPASDMLGLRVDVSQGDYRAGDDLWLQRLPPERFSEAEHRDALAAQGVGGFAFGRVLSATPSAVTILPLTPGGKPVTLADPGWIAVAVRVVRTL
ncbi:MAG: XRE family transcriptional regulator [Sphingomonadales bacterium]|nr:MAG: XRE family transcriptional regulator [Sphingomonadales bacterium]